MPKVLSPKLFPLCPQGFSPTGKELVFTLKQAMEFYWRVKRWQVVITALFTGPSAPNFPININEQFNLLTGTGQGRGAFSFPYAGIPPSSESDLVCAAGNLWGFDFYGPVGKYSLVWGTSQGAGSVQCIIAANAYNKSGQNYEFSIFVFANSGLAQAGLEPGNGGFPNVSVCGSFSIQLNEGLVSAPLYCRYFNDYFIVLNIQMVGLEYWSYGGTWNTSTGQPA